MPLPSATYSPRPSSVSLAPHLKATNPAFTQSLRSPRPVSHRGLRVPPVPSTEPKVRLRRPLPLPKSPHA